MSFLKTDKTTYVFPIDEYCEYKGEILIDDGDVYSCTLNQTDIGSNKNKFYIMQLIKQHNNKYILFIRYGRISEKGRTEQTSFATSSDAIQAFEKQFKSKTGNNWKSRANFVKKDKKYFMAEITYETTEKLSDKPKEIIKSKLDDRVLNLMGLLSNTDNMNNTLIELDIDPKKMPLGKITNDQLEKAKNVLAEIKTILTKTNVNLEKELMDMSSKFYTFIPYSCGRRKPPIIRSQEMIDNYTNMIEELKNLAVAVKITNDIKNNTDKHPCDVVYDSLNTTINALSKDSDMWKHICDYVNNTHASTHNYKTEILDIFQISRNSEADKYNDFTKNIHNKTLLWHGSRVTNFCSIMQKGLILNPESLGVPIAGKMFGYGVYFSDTFSKSFNYCASESSGNVGVLLLCEVALGNTLNKLDACTHLGPNDMQKNGTHSTWGKGKQTPSGGVKIENVRIPNGKLANSHEKSVLLYNEYIVYNTNQIKQAYLVVVKKV